MGFLSQSAHLTAFGAHAISVVSTLLTLLFVSMIIRAKKAPSSMLAWLLFVVLAPYLAVPVYILLGGRKQSSRKAPPKSRLYASQGPQPATGSLSGIAERAGTPPPRQNCAVRFMTTGTEAYQRLMAELEGAKERIWIETFIFSGDSTGKAVLECLQKKAAAGLDVRVLVDALGSVWMNHPSFRKLEAQGGKIAYFEPLLGRPFRLANLRNHRKLVLIDRKVAVTGGMNLGREYLGPEADSLRWVDLAFRLEGECVGDLERVFTADWSYARKEPEAPPKTPPKTPMDAPLPPAAPPSPAGSALIQIVGSGPDVESDPLYDILISAFFDARTRIWIATPYFIPDEALTKALELAARRGVDLRIIVPKRSNHLLADLGRGSYLRQLERAGGRIHFFPRMIHAKAVLVDQDFGVAGSANLDLRSLLLNYELGVLLYTRAEVDFLGEWFSALFAQSRIGAGEATYGRELIEGLGRLFSPVL